MEPNNQNSDFYVQSKESQNNTLDPKSIFEEFLTSKRIFKNKEALSSAFVPDEITHRNNEIVMLSKIVAPSLLFERIF